MVLFVCLFRGGWDRNREVEDGSEEEGGVCGVGEVVGGSRGKEIVGVSLVEQPMIVGLFVNRTNVRILLDFWN